MGRDSLQAKLWGSSRMPKKLLSNEWISRARYDDTESPGPSTVHLIVFLRPNSICDSTLDFFFKLQGSLCARVCST